MVLKPGLNLTIPLSTESELRRWLESAVRSAGRRREVSLKWAGSWLRLEIPDRASVPDGVQRAVEVPEKNIRQSSDAVARRKKAIAQFPGTVVTPLADPAALAQSLRLLKAGLTEGLDGHLDWQELAPYRGFSITRFTETLSQERSRIGVSIAHSQDWVVLALNQTGIELAINRLMDAPLVAEGSKAIEGTLTLNDSKWLRNALAGVAETVVFPRRLQALNAVRSPHGAEGNPYGVQERPNHGVVHTDFGSSDMPRFLKLSRMKGPFSEHTDALSSFSISLKNEPSEAALTAVLKWTRKARQ